MIFKAFVTLVAIISIIIISTFSYALMQDIVDPITGRRVRDNQARMYGFIGYLLTCAISFGLWHYLFN